MALSVEEVRHVAALARLSLTPQEEATLRADLSAILAAFESLQALDTTAVEPTSHAAFAPSALREDEPQPSLGTDRALQNAPAKQGTSFAVPRIID